MAILQTRNGFLLLIEQPIITTFSDNSSSLYGFVNNLRLVLAQ